MPYVNNAISIDKESLFAVWATAMSAFQLDHIPQLLRSVYALWVIEYELSNMGKY